MQVKSVNYVINFRCDVSLFDANKLTFALLKHLNKKTKKHIKIIHLINSAQYEKQDFFIQTMEHLNAKTQEIFKLIQYELYDDYTGTYYLAM